MEDSSGILKEREVIAVEQGRDKVHVVQPAGSFFARREGGLPFKGAGAEKLSKLSIREELTDFSEKVSALIQKLDLDMGLGLEARYSSKTKDS